MGLDLMGMVVWLNIWLWYMKKFTLINKNRSIIKVFELFEDVSKP